MTELIYSGVELMLVGMGIVFAFLVMLIGAIQLMTKGVARYFPEPEVMRTPLNTAVDPTIVAAISAAVHQYRNTHK